ncbi:BspA family leucine-rich repeat surface protein [Mycoplasma mycoides]|uniref:BspA family leucine-rich repeat surface protein n=1 Tax=Mycoplasma mycoides TaxID=2102 RepID=UPI00223F4F4A|nr:BspA family leucine-rich repeat surface protein [Mycoplasma mycoides]QVK03795.1 BspA family leucine-rich repeat surface protein [Mycoplasma mycoides subsp. capri]
MKKVLTLLTSFSLIATSSVLVVSCKTVDIKKLFEKPKNTTEDSSKKDEKKLESINKDLKDDNLKNKSELGSSNKDNIFSSAEDERVFIKDYYKHWEGKKDKNAPHVFNPENPNEILVFGFEKTQNPKDGYKLKQIPTNVNKVPGVLPQKVTSLEGAFKNNENENIDGIENWDTSHIVNMYQTFFGAKKFNGDISKWNTSNVKNFDYMFSWTELFNRDLSKWDVSKDPFQVNFAKNSTFENNKNLWPNFSNKNS